MERKRLAPAGGKEMSAQRTKRPRLCEDLVGEILSRLPARSAARCAVLSKRWREFVTSPDFWLHHHRPPSSDSDSSIAYVDVCPESFGQKPAQRAFHLVGPSCSFAQGFVTSGRLHGLDCSYVGTCNGLVALEMLELYCDCSFFTCAVLNPATTEEVSPIYLELGEEHCLCGFGYGPKSKTYKLLVVKPKRGGGTTGPLRVLSLGDVRGQARTVFPEADADCLFPLSIGGKVYLLDGSRYMVLAFDVDRETIDTVKLPVAFMCSGPMEVRGRLCVAMQNDGRYDGRYDELSLWLLTSSDRLVWERRCVVRHDFSRCWHCWVVGAWDSGDNRLLIWFRCEGLVLYDLRKTASNGGAHEPAGRWMLEEPRDRYQLYPFGKNRICWGYRPTSISPRSIIGNCTGAAPVLCDFRSGRRSPESPTTQSFNVLSGLVKTLLDGKEVVDQDEPRV